jgi:hypothetical protein
MRTEQLLFEISEKLDRIMALVAIRTVEERAEQVRLLDSLGLDARTIAAVTGMTPNAVALRLSRMRRGVQP